MSPKKKRKMRGKVEKIIKPLTSEEPEKAQIAIDEADPLYREIRVENEVTDDAGNKARLKERAEVEVTIEADSSATEVKTET